MIFIARGIQTIVLSPGLRLIAVALLAYAVPTLLEFAASRALNPWIAVILPGDVVGCACLAFLFGKLRIGMALYLFLTAVEGFLFVIHVIPVGVLLWFTDLVPTVVLSGVLLRSPVRNTSRISVS